MNNKQNTALRCFLIPSQNKKVENLRNKVSKQHDLGFYKTDIVKIAIAELLENTTNDKELEALLEKHQYI